MSELSRRDLLAAAGAVAAVGLTAGAGMPTHTFTDTLGLAKGGLATADKPDETLFIVEPS
ncbi:MAG TPA: twin-arginine translocation signal domain-containing protein [Ilumatobacteraceae bacterium]|nr:twin-arginine translocation signal domain-containing protein [Ilumatobacteraceae bacterium]